MLEIHVFAFFIAIAIDEGTTIMSTQTAVTDDTSLVNGCDWNGIPIGRFIWLFYIAKYYQYRSNYRPLKATGSSRSLYTY